MSKLHCLLLPGMDGTGELFDDFTQAISPFLQPIIISYPQDELLSYAELAQYTSQYVPKQDPFVIIAESFSGPAGILLAQQYKDQARALILSTSFCYAPFPKIVASSMMTFAPIIQSFTSSPMLINSMLLDGYTTALAERTAEIVQTIPTHTMTHRIKTALSCDVREELASLTLPILSLEATHDRVILPHVKKQLQDANPQIITKPVASPHFLLQTCPQDAASHIKDFLKQQNL